MNYALVNTESTVANIIVADAEFAAKLQEEWTAVIELGDLKANIGDTWDGSSFVPQAPSAELEAKKVRSIRNLKLQECDWTQLPDAPFNVEAKSAWAFYRENLRMVPDQANFPWDVVWPPQPNT